MGEDVDSDLENDKLQTIHQKMKDKNRQQTHDPSHKFKAANAPVAKKRDMKGQAGHGHIVKASGDQYKSNQGKGDVLKSGTHEPYAYIKLNPEMLNPKKKQ